MKILFLLITAFLVTFQDIEVNREFVNVNPVVAERFNLAISKLDLSSRSNLKVLFSFGETEISKRLVPNQDLQELGSEGYIIKSAKRININSTLYDFIIAGRGNSLVDHYPNHPKNDQPLGTSYALLKSLEILGFGFFHPLHLTVPDTTTFIQRTTEDINIKTKPKFVMRGTHLHTMHPIELTEYLNGFGTNLNQTDDSWKEMSEKYDSFLEWMVANHQNMFEWYLLWAYNWRSFGDSDIRLNRLTYIIKRAQQFGIVSGIVAPFVFMQQHSYNLVREAGSEKFESQQIQKRLDWLFKTDCDFVTVEMGFSEFTHGNGTRMLFYLNEATKHVFNNYKRKGVYTKIHISANQFIDDYNDPETGKPPLNFNFLPYYADKRLGVFPHTVQLYSLDDEAPTYGNQNFTHLFKYMFLEADRRETIFYPETCYWVFYDMTVPLFLPLYADRRLHDLRLINREERRTNKKIRGQINFSSGWEFGYWLNDMITARAAWDPLMEMNDERAFDTMLKLYTSSLGTLNDPIRKILTSLIRDQKDLLIDGKVNGVKPRINSERNGIAYLQGWDTWADIPVMLNVGIDAQPRRLLWESVLYGRRVEPDYEKEIQPLLREMDQKFTLYAEQLKGFLPRVPRYSFDLYEDIVESAIILSLRAKFVYTLFEYAHGYQLRKPREYLERLKTNADQIFGEAKKWVEIRSKKYKLSDKLIAAWRENPTAYAYTYLWTAQTLHYWKRDYDKVFHRIQSPCHMNIQNPLDIAIGQGIIHNFAKTLRKTFENTFLSFITNCLAAPENENKL